VLAAARILIFGFSVNFQRVCDNKFRKTSAFFLNPLALVSVALTFHEKGSVGCN